MASISASETPATTTMIVAAVVAPTIRVATPFASMTTVDGIVARR